MHIRYYVIYVKPWLVLSYNTTLYIWISCFCLSFINLCLQLLINDAE